MPDLIGGRTFEMDATASRFVAQAEQFTTSLAQISSAVSALLQDWYGNAPQAYNAAMGKWNTDARAIVADLEGLTSQLRGSSTALTELDSQLASQIAGFGG